MLCGVPGAPQVSGLPSHLKCTQIAAGGNNSAFVLEGATDCEVYVVGHGQYGQHGNGSVRPRLIARRPVRRSACGLGPCARTRALGPVCGGPCAGPCAPGPGCRAHDVGPTLVPPQYTHMRGDPVRVRELSNRRYYNEATRQLDTIRVKYISCGARHLAGTGSPPPTGRPRRMA